MVIIDNYDSFTYNLVEYFRILGEEPKVFKNDEININELVKENFKHLIISPGWGNPDNSGISIEAINKFYKTKKILGVCLGHQCIYKYFGGSIIKAENPMHGKTSSIFYKRDEKLFQGIKQGFKATRYHSLIACKNTLPKDINIIAETKTGEIMAIKHNFYPVYGVQFHPESILTESGINILKNFIDAC